MPESSRKSKPDGKVRSRTIVFVVVIIIALASAASLFQTIHKFRNIPFSWDSAAYACDGLIIARDLKAGDLISFLGDTYGHGWWPFFHSWLLAPAFILFGNTYASARLVSLFCFIISILTIYWIGAEMSRKYGHWIGLVTVYLVVTSLPFLVMSAMAMEEIPGLMMTFVTFLCFLRARRENKSRLFFLTSILMALALFTKWHHGVFAIFAVFLTQLTSERKIFSHNNIQLFFPFLVMVAGWFVYPRHLLSFLGHSTFQPQYYEFWSAANWLYYPKSFLQVYHTSVIVAAIIAISFLISFKNIKDYKTRLLAAHVFIGIVLMTIKLDNRHRYILTIVPSIWLLGAHQLFRFLDYARSQIADGRTRRILAASGALAFLIFSLLTVPGLYKRYPDSLQKYELSGDEKQNAAYAFIAQNTFEYNHIAVFGSWDYYNSLRGSAIRWNIEIERNRARAEIMKTKKMARDYFFHMLKNRNKESYSKFIRFLENKNVRVEEYHLLSFMKELDVEAYQEFRKNTEINPFSDRITSVNSLGENVDCLITICRDGEADLNSYANQFLKVQEKWELVRKQSLFDLGITTAIYERKVTSFMKQARNEWPKLTRTSRAYV